MSKQDSTKVSLDSLSTLLKNRTNSINEYNETLKDANNTFEHLLTSFGYTLKTILVMFLIILSVKYVMETVEFYFDKNKFLKRSEELRFKVIDNSSILVTLSFALCIILGLKFMELNFGVVAVYFLMTLISFWLIRTDYLEEDRSFNEILISFFFWLFAIAVIIPIIIIISDHVYKIFSYGFNFRILFKIILYYLSAILIYYTLSYLFAIVNNLILSKLNKE